VVASGISIQCRRSGRLVKIDQLPLGVADIEDGLCPRRTDGVF